MYGGLADNPLYGWLGALGGLGQPSPLEGYAAQQWVNLGAQQRQQHKIPNYDLDPRMSLEGRGSIEIVQDKLLPEKGREG